MRKGSRSWSVGGRGDESMMCGGCHGTPTGASNSDNDEELEEDKTKRRTRVTVTGTSKQPSSRGGRAGERSPTWQIEGAGALLSGEEGSHRQGDRGPAEVLGPLTVHTAPKDKGELQGPCTASTAR